MKMITLALAVLMLAPSAFAKSSTNDLRLKIASIPEVKAVYSIYKGGGWKCRNTVVEKVDANHFTASKSCVNSDGFTDSSVSIEIKGTIYGDDKDQDLVVDSLSFSRAG